MLFEYVDRFSVLSRSSLPKIYIPLSFRALYAGELYSFIFLEGIMTKLIFIVCVVALVAVPLLADSPFGRSLILDGTNQYIELPDSTCPELAETNILTIEIRIKPYSTDGYNLLNKWKYFPPDYSRLGHSTFKGHGWLIDVNKYRYS